MKKLKTKTQNIDNFLLEKIIINENAKMPVKKDELINLSPVYRRLQAKCQLVRIKVVLFSHIINIFLADLCPSVWENLDPRVLTSVKIFPYRPTELGL